MATPSVPKPKKRRLKAPAETVRQRAQHAATADTKRPKRRPVRTGLAKLGRLKIWKPFKKPLRFVGRILVPPYIRNSWKELRDVTWTSRKETRRLTTAVIIFSIVFGAVVALADYGLDKLFKEVLLK